MIQINPEINSWTFTTRALSSTFCCLAILFIFSFLIWRTSHDYYVIQFTPYYKTTQLQIPRRSFTSLRTADVSIYCSEIIVTWMQ